MSLFRKSPAAPTTLPAPPTTGPAAAAAQAPAGLVNLVKTAAVSLQKQGLTGWRAAVYLVLDRSFSMAQYYADGSVQHLGEQTLGLSANLDDDGEVPLIFFDTNSYPVVPLSLNSYMGVVAATHQQFGGENTMGGTRYTLAMQAVIDHYQASGANDPAFVIFQTDGMPQDADATKNLLQAASDLPLFWSFVGFGPKPVPFLQQLDTLRGRRVDNASYFHAGAHPKRVDDADIYDGITREYPAWLTAAHSAGITR